MRKPRVLLMALLLGGCAVGPNYAPPKAPPSAAGPFVSNEPRAESADTPQDKWWRLYQDPVLDGLVQEALTENADLKVAAANLAYAQALLGEAKAGLLPTTTVSGGATYGVSSDDQLFASLAGQKAKASTFSDYGFTAAYQVDLFGRVRRTIEAQHANAEAARAAEDAVRVTVAAQTAGAYANVCTYGGAVEAAKRNLNVAQQGYDLTEVQRNAGAISDLDLSRQTVLLDQAKAVLPTVEGQRRAALFELAALTGRTPSQAPQAVLSCTRAPTIAQPIPTGDGAMLLRRRPDVREAERNLAANTARIGIATADLFPTISLGGNVAGGGTTLRGLTSANAITYGIGPAISWSFPNIAVARAHIREASAQASGSLASFDSVVLQALKETEQALTTYDAEIQQDAATRAARDEAAHALELARIQYTAGSISSLDLLTTEQTAVTTEQALASADQQLAADQIAVFQALGGGWETAPPVRVPKISKK
jgi:NodT family efflux transporter outer membrane factor (OMF) lipoprotein